MEASFTNHSTGQPTVIELNGDFWGGTADLSVQGGPVIAQITRDAFSMREVFTNQQVVGLTKHDSVVRGVTEADEVVLCACGSWGRSGIGGCYLYLLRRGEERPQALGKLKEQRDI